MNTRKIIKLTLGLIMVSTSLFLLSFTKIYKHKNETQIVYGGSIQTQDLHNVTGWVGPAPRGIEYKTFANACFRKYSLSVSVGPGWHFTGQPFVNLVSQDQGAREGFGWNNFAGAHDRFFITQRGTNIIVATCWAGSHPLLINLACEATKD